MRHDQVWEPREGAEVLRAEEKGKRLASRLISRTFATAVNERYGGAVVG